MINYERVAEKIFSVIKGHDHDLVMFTDEGMETSNAEEARRFFVSKPNYMVTLDPEARHIKINKNSNVSLEDMESIMKQLKNLATSNMLKTEIRVFGKEITPKDFAYQAKNLKEPAMTESEKRDPWEGKKKQWDVYIPANTYQGKYYEAYPVRFPVPLSIAPTEEEAVQYVLDNPEKVYQHFRDIRKRIGRRGQGMVALPIEKNIFMDKEVDRRRIHARPTRALESNTMTNIQEASFSRMHGFKKTSYQTLESTKIVVRHRQPVEEEVRGSRARNIQAIFIEHAGERFRFPHNNLAGARAMARHINEGGEVHDPIGKYIIESISNYNKLMEFMRYARTNKLINEDSEDIVKTVRESMGIIRREIGQLQGAKTYGSMKEQIEASDINVIEETGDDVSELQDMFTVRKFDEKIGDVLPIVKKLMDNKTAWRDALVEASEKQIFISEKSEISETDIFEFDSPTQRMGYRVRDIAERMIGESDLQTFVGKVAGKLIEGEQISAFEKKVVGNVLGNAVIREEEEICEECGEVMENCGCSTKDVLDLISEQFELKMKMVEHEDIFTEKEVVNEGDLPTHPQSEWWKNDPDVLLGYIYWLSNQLPPEPKEEAWEKVKAQLSKKNPPPEGVNPMLGDGPLEEADDHHADEIAAGAHSGYPKREFDVNTTDVSEIADAVIDDLAGDFDDPNVILRAVTNFIGSDDPAVDDVYQEVLDRINFQDYDDGQPTEYEEWQDVYGGDDWDFGQYDENVEEDFERDRADRDYSSLAGNADCPSCNGTGANTGRKMLTHGWNCPDCKGTGKVLEAQLDEERDPCPHCKGTGEPQEAGGWDDLDDLGLCMMCDGSGKLPYEKGSKQDPFGGNYGVDVEDFMDGNEDDIF